MTTYFKNATETTYNGKADNALKFGFTPQSELWNNPLAMIAFGAYLLWDPNGYSLLREVLLFGS